MAPARPPVSVVLPFHGTPEEADAALDALARLRLEPGDEIIVADNTGADVVRPRGVRVVRADGERSAYHARNVAAAEARGVWLAFLDADCVPEPRLLEAYFSAPIG